MSYVRKHRGPVPLAGPLDAVMGAVQAASKIVEDPALPEVTRLVLKLHSLQRSSAPTRPGAPAPAPARGIGLAKIVPPLRAYVYAEENWWVKPAAIAAILAVPFMLGRLSKKR